MTESSPGGPSFEAARRRLEATNRDMIGYGRDVPDICWPNGARVAVSIGVHVIAGAERSPLDGDEGPEPVAEGTASSGPRRNLFIESLYEYGPRRGIWRTLDTLKRVGVPATFFCAGLALERAPHLSGEILAGGHEIAASGYRWVEAIGMAEQEEQDHVARAVEIIEKQTGEQPRGWFSRSPNPRTRALLASKGFIYDCDSYGDDLPYSLPDYGRDYVVMPRGLFESDANFWLIPEISGFSTPEHLLTVLTKAVERQLEESRTKYLPIELHPHIVGRPGRNAALLRFLERFATERDVWFATREVVARHWLEQTS